MPVRSSDVNGPKPKKRTPIASSSSSLKENRECEEARMSAHKQNNRNTVEQQEILRGQQHPNHHHDIYTTTKQDQSDFGARGYALSSDPPSLGHHRLASLLGSDPPMGQQHPSLDGIQVSKESTSFLIVDLQ
jgi:hypothetical protein